jgi:hypothetical protein
VLQVSYAVVVTRHLPPGLAAALGSV